jgi:hypothetical protein
MSTATQTRPPTTPSRRSRRARVPSPATRRFGFAVAVAVNLTLLYLINVAPGWDAGPVLSDDFPRLLPILNASLLIGTALNVAYLPLRPGWLRPAGETALAAVNLAVLVRMWQVFPFDFAGYGGDTTHTVARILLVLAAAGTGLAVFIHLAALLRTRTERAGRR